MNVISVTGKRKHIHGVFATIGMWEYILVYSKFHLSITFAPSAISSPFNSIANISSCSLLHNSSLMLIVSHLKNFP